MGYAHVNGVRKRIRSPETKHLLKVNHRPGLPNQYDFTPLSKTLMQATQECTPTPQCTPTPTPRCRTPLHPSVGEEEKQEQLYKKKNLAPPSGGENPPTPSRDPASLPDAETQTALLFGPSGKRDRAAVADPTAPDEWADGPLTTLCDGLGLDIAALPDKKRAQWVRRLRKIGADWAATPEDIIRALRALFKSKEFGWKTYSGPYGALETDVGLILGRIKSGKPSIKTKRATARTDFIEPAGFAAIRAIAAEEGW